MRLVALSIDVKGGGAAPTHDRKRRSVLKRVEVTADDGRTKMLTVENSMRTIVAWLDKMNQDHASTYSVDRLVWCEEQSSARSEKGTIRGWFKYDISDGNKRKVVPNASDAIVAMEQITKTDFYAEMKSNFKAYDVDIVEQAITGNASGSAGVSKGKATSEVSVIYMPMPSDDSD